MKKIKLIGFMAITFMLTLNSCKKEGCVDVNAVNYNTDAKKDNGTCTYSGENVIFYGEDVAQFLVDNNYTSLTYYVGGTLVGSSAASVYFTSEPACGAEGSITITRDLGVAKNKTFDYEVKDEDGTILWEGTLNFTANTCSSLELKL